MALLLLLSLLRTQNLKPHRKGKLKGKRHMPKFQKMNVCAIFGSNILLLQYSKINRRPLNLTNRSIYKRMGKKGLVILKVAWIVISLC